MEGDLSSYKDGSMIIVEGADNVGKTTLVRQLREQDPELRLLKRKKFNPRKNETIGSSYIKALIPPDGNLDRHGYSIADRMLASECIYGELFRGGCRMTEEEHESIHNLLDSYQALVVWCDAPDSAILRTWTNRGQLYDDPLVIARAYRTRIHEVFRRPIIRYDWTAADAHSQVHTILAVHRYVQTRLDRSRVDTGLFLNHVAGED